MEYNWKYVKISANCAKRVWDRHFYYTHIIRFLRSIKGEFEIELRDFACWCIEKILNEDEIDKAYEGALATSKRVVKGLSKKRELQIAAGRYEGQRYWELIKGRLNIEGNKGPDPTNLAWLQVMLHLCHEDGYDCASGVMGCLELLIEQQTIIAHKKNVGMDIDEVPIAWSMFEKLNKIYVDELNNRFDYIFDEEYLEYYVRPNVISLWLGVGPFRGNDLQPWTIEGWTYGSWIFCIENEIIK